MKEIKLVINDEIFLELKSELVGKAITGNLYTITDAFLSKIIKALENENEVLRLGK